MAEGQHPAEVAASRLLAPAVWFATALPRCIYSGIDRGETENQPPEQQQFLQDVFSLDPDRDRGGTQ